MAHSESQVQGEGGSHWPQKDKPGPQPINPPIYPGFSEPTHLSSLPTRKFFKKCNDSKVLGPLEPSLEYLSLPRSLSSGASSAHLPSPSLPKDFKIQGKLIYNFSYMHRVREDFEAPSLGTICYLHLCQARISLGRKTLGEESAFSPGIISRSTNSDS